MAAVIHRALVLLAFYPALAGARALWRFPAYAAHHGAGTGDAWPAAAVAAGAASLALVVAVGLAWALARRRPRWAALLPAAAALATALGRRLATVGGPEELYLVDDGKWWVALLVGAVVLSLALAAVAPARGGSTLAAA